MTTELEQKVLDTAEAYAFHFSCGWKGLSIDQQIQRLEAKLSRSKYTDDGYPAAVHEHQVACAEWYLDRSKKVKACEEQQRLKREREKQDAEKRANFERLMQDRKKQEEQEKMEADKKDAEERAKTDERIRNVAEVLMCLDGLTGEEAMQKAYVGVHRYGAYLDRKNPNRVHRKIK